MKFFLEKIKQLNIGFKWNVIKEELENPQEEEKQEKLEQTIEAENKNKKDKNELNCEI